jgi:hypothetical protein
VTQLERIRWGARAALALGIAASITGNVLHAQDNPISQAISAWPPAAFLITVELISRIPLRTRGLTAARVGAAAVVAAIAAWVSYWHMAAVASRYGETSASPYLLPLSVDGLVVVASICLVELAGRISAAEEEVSDGQVPGQEAAASGRSGPKNLQGDRQGDGPREGGAAERGDGRDLGHRGGPRPQEVGPVPVAAPAPAQIEPPRKPHTTNPQRIARAHRQHPDATHEELARRLKLSPATVKRYRPAAASEGAPPKVNGHVPEFVAAAASEEEN